jgi:SAM-dependent methyltransferase
MRRIRLVGKSTLATLGRVLPATCFRPLRAMAERIAFRLQPGYQGDTLPPIFHYWSNQCLSPRLSAAGLRAPEHFFLDEILVAARALRRPVEVASFGAGACSLEIDLVRRLQAHGVEVSMTCIDFNAALLRKAGAAARAQGLAAAMRFRALDCNRLPPLPEFDVIVVNQFLHHVEELESFCASLRLCLAPGGVLLSSDIVGRNGHMPWADVLEAITEAWSALPPERRYDRHFDRVLEAYRPVDHAAYSNEGIRAQEVVERLLAEFEFDVFFTWGGSVMPFIERRFGFNFDADDAVDQAFIRTVDAQDTMSLGARCYPASNMLAALRHKGCARRKAFSPIDPHEHVRLVRRQLHRLARA